MMRLARLLPVLLVAACGCTMVIRPPSAVPDATTVYIADYQLHASLLLPRADGTLTEYAYGEWDWFALNHEGVLDALRIAAFPARGALGRRTLAAAADADELRALMGVEAVYPVAVDPLRAAIVLRHLDDAYAAEQATEIYNPQEQMTFVRSGRLYWTGWNCNHALAAWLDELGCDVSGCRAFSNFRVVPDADAD